MSVSNCDLSQRLGESMRLNLNFQNLWVRAKGKEAGRGEKRTHSIMVQIQKANNSVSNGRCHLSLHI